jgi:uncharacterized coiled-coil DUF342 family protein
MADITRDFVKGKAAFNNIPILTLNERYYKLFPEGEEKPEVIRALEDKVNALMRKEGQINNDIKDVKKIKARLMKNVVDTMDITDEDDPKHSRKMDESHRLIQEAKSKISSLEDEAEEVPKKLRKANQELMIATVQYCYGKMNANGREIKSLDRWIADARVKLKKNLLIKQEKEEQNNQMYQCLHDILGHEAMGLLDVRNEE